MNQYEIDYQQGYDTANEEWLDRIKQVREEIGNIDWKSCSSKIVDGIRIWTELIDREDVLSILDSLITESEEE